MPFFKTDESFLQKISLGAIGTQEVFKRLLALGHTPIELERGSMSYKIWKTIKVKRIRVPDILCVDNGIRIESRAKQKLEIKMSHSRNNPDRAWDVGLKDEDYVALVGCRKASMSPIDWVANSEVQFVSVKKLRESFSRDEVVIGKPKGVEEGSEVTVTWISKKAEKEAVITEISAEKIKAVSKDGSKCSWSLKSTSGGKDIRLQPLVKVNETIYENQIVASVIPIQREIPKGNVDENYYIRNLNNLNYSERYASAKALRHFSTRSVISALKAKTASSEENLFFVKLEAAASLAILGEEEGYAFLETSLKDQFPMHILEAVIVLNEIKSEKACKLLCDVLLNESFDPEIRAGAAWGLGEQQNKIALNAIVSSFNEVDEGIRVEAARALAKLTKNFSNNILEKFIAATPTEKPGVAWALSKSNSLSLDELLASINDLDSKHWVSYIIGTQGEEKYIAEIEKIKAKDPEVYFAVTLLWKIMTSWIYELKEY